MAKNLRMNKNISIFFLWFEVIISSILFLLYIDILPEILSIKNQLAVSLALLFIIFLFINIILKISYFSFKKFNPKYKKISLMILSFFIFLLIFINLVLNPAMIPLQLGIGTIFAINNYNIFVNPKKTKEN